jgi:hypothetical protein
VSASQFPRKNIFFTILLQIMYSATATTDPDYQDLEDALAKISELSDIVLKSNVKAGEMQQILAVQKKLSDIEVCILLLLRLMMVLGNPHGRRKSIYKGRSTHDG